MIKIGIIGTGNMGKNHVRIAKELNHEFEFIGFFDKSEERRKEIEKMYDVKGFGDLDELLAKVDAVVIAVPSSLHKEIGEKVANAKVHALIEKPLALNKKDAEYLCEVFKKNNRVLMVGHVERFNQAILELQKILENEKIIAIDVKRCSPYDPRIADTNVILDLMIHDIDIVINNVYNKKIKTISAVGENVKSNNKLDYVSAMLQFEDGVIANIIASRVTEEKIRQLSIHTENGYIEADMLNKTLNIYRRTNYEMSTSGYKQENIVEKVFLPMVEPLKAEQMEFAKAIETGIIKVSGEDATKAIELANIIEEKCYN